MMIVEIIISLFLVWLISYYVNVYITRRSLPSGPFPFPFVGNIPQMMLADPVDPFAKLAEKYGDIFSVAFPKGNAVILSSASLVREAKLVGQSIAGKSMVYPLDVMLGGSVAAADYSQAYLFDKKVFVSAMHVFGAGKEEASSQVEHAIGIAVEEIEKNPGKPFSVRENILRSMVVQLWKWLTSRELSLDDPIVDSLIEFDNLIAKQALLNTVYQLFPFIGSLPTQFARDIHRAGEIRKTIYPPDYLQHRKTYTPGVIRDLIDSFISAYEKEIAKETHKEVGSMENITGLMLNVVFGGSTTATTSLTWFFLYMVVHPEIQKKIHEELDDVVGKDRLPTWEDSKNMPYLQATLCEVQRASGLLGLIGSDAIRDISIAGYHIPKGTFVAFNLPKIHHDEREWAEPEKFKPERFLDGDGKFVGWNKMPSFIPFGIGQRECPGQQLAKIVMFTFASVLLHRYDIELPDGAEKPSTTISTPMLLRRPNDYLVVAKKRNFK